MWRINIDPPADSVGISFGSAGDERWWEQADLTKLILAGNLLRELSEDIMLLSALAVLDVGCQQPADSLVPRPTHTHTPGIRLGVWSVCMSHTVFCESSAHTLTYT